MNSAWQPPRILPLPSSSPCRPRFLAIFAVLLGLVFGSFLNVCIAPSPPGRVRCPAALALPLLRPPHRQSGQHSLAELDTFARPMQILRRSNHMDLSSNRNSYFPAIPCVLVEVWTGLAADRLGDLLLSSPGARRHGCTNHAPARSLHDSRSRPGRALRGASRRISGR